jgi:hypothetical protein
LGDQLSVSVAVAVQFLFSVQLWVSYLEIFVEKLTEKLGRFAVKKKTLFALLSFSLTPTRVIPYRL